MALSRLCDLVKRRMPVRERKSGQRSDEVEGIVGFDLGLLTCQPGGGDRDWTLCVN